MIQLSAGRGKHGRIWFDDILPGDWKPRAKKSQSLTKAGEEQSKTNHFSFLKKWFVLLIRLETKNNPDDGNNKKKSKLEKIY